MSKSLLLFVASAWASAASAAAFDDCILKSMHGVTSDAAARAIQTACLHKAESAISPAAALSLNAAASAGFDPGKGFFVELNNRSDYTITSISILVLSKGTDLQNIYSLDYFEPEGVSTGSIIIKDRFAPEFHSIQPGQRLTFRVPVAEKAESANDFADKYIWRITAARGFRSLGK